MNTTKKSLLWLLPILCLVLSIAVYATSAQEEVAEKPAGAEKPAYAGNYEAHVWLRVAKSRPKLLFDREIEEHYLTDRDAQPTLICSGIVLDTALEQPGIAQLDCLKNEEDKKEWLIKNLKVGFLGNSEILQIAITGKNPAELMKILLAVREAYLDRVVGIDEELQNRRQMTLEQLYKNTGKILERKKAAYKERTDELGVPDSETARQVCIYSLESMAKLRNNVNRLRAEIAGMDQKIVVLKARLELISKENQAAGEAQANDYRKKLAIDLLAKDAGVIQLQFEIRSKDAAVNALAEQLENPDEDPELAAMREQLEESKQKLQTRAKELIPLIEEAVFQITRGEKAPTRPEEMLQQAIDQTLADKAAHQAEIESYMKAFQQAITTTEKFSAGVQELSEQQAELKHMEAMYHQMGTTLEEWTIEAQAAKRVSVINEPTVRKIR